MSINPDMAVKLRKSLVKHEGCKNFPYLDTVGKVTIGIGYNLTDRGIDNAWIDKAFQDDVAHFYQQWLNTFDWYADLNDDRQVVLIDMAFQGWKHVMGFTTMLLCLDRGNHAGAADAMLDSLWARQVGQRAKDLAEGMRTGVYNP